MDLFDDAFLTQDKKLKVPMPTGAFWTNLVVRPTSDRGISYPSMVYPYGFNWSPTMLQISYPPLRRLHDPLSIRDIFNPDMAFNSVEQITSRKVIAFDPLSVSVRFTSYDINQYWESYLVQGSPYITLKYSDTTPILTPISIYKKFFCARDAEGKINMNAPQIEGVDRFGICEVVHLPKMPTEPVILKGVEFVAQTPEGLTWMIFASEPVTLEFDFLHKRTITATEKFNGILRMALLPPGFEGSTTGLKHLIDHANQYPTGAALSWDFPETNDPGEYGTVNFNFEVKNMRHESRKDLLMLALPHHTEVLPSNTLLSKGEFDITYKCIKGPMTPVIGSSWSYQEPLTNFTLEDSSSLNNIDHMKEDVQEKIMKQIKFDVERLLPVGHENVYGLGKQIARLAQLAHIAHMITTTHNTTYSDIADHAASVLNVYLTRYLRNEYYDYLLHDVDFGGLISINGIKNHEADFGNGWYNDHHFHYGYILYASGIMAKLNTTFAIEYGPTVDAIMNDVAHMSNEDGFPLARHKSWFDSHSFASGLFPFGNGKSMESSSESINCYYGAFLWSYYRKGTDNSPLINYTRLLLAMEIRGVKTYWHMMPPNQGDRKRVETFNADFSGNYMVGNLAMSDVVLGTWFGTEPLYVHMINFMPITSITRETFDHDYIEGEFNHIIKPIYDTVPMAWRGYTVCDKAMLDPTDAWTDALKLRSYELDSGLSLSQVLFFISTTNGFVPPDPEKPKPSKNSVCSANPKCAAANLKGECCPTAAGLMLGCCEKVLNTRCENNPQCKAINLAGFCCPSLAGDMLGCCDQVVNTKCENHPKCKAINLEGFCCPSLAGVFLGCCDSQ